MAIGLAEFWPHRKGETREEILSKLKLERAESTSFWKYLEPDIYPVSPTHDLVCSGDVGEVVEYRDEKHQSLTAVQPINSEFPFVALGHYDQSANLWVLYAVAIYDEKASK